MTGKALGYLITYTGAFIGGIAVGMLLSPKTGKENRVAFKKGAHHVKEFSSHRADDVARTIKKNIPDLYEATTSFSLNIDDMNTLQK